MTFQPCRASAISAKWSSRAARRGRAEKADKSSIGPSRIIGPKESFLFLPPEVTDSPSSQKTALTSPRRPDLVAYVAGYVEWLVVYSALAKASTRPRRGFWHSEQRLPYTVCMKIVVELAVKPNVPFSAR